MSASLMRFSALQFPRQGTQQLPDYLVPCLSLRLSTATCHSSSFFSSSARMGYPRDLNRNRGVSPLRRTGLRHPLSVSRKPLPKPVLDPKLRPKIEVDENHGLWGFFNKKRTLLNTPEQDAAYGRAWNVEELRHKSWDDLYHLWWICCKERNRISTMSAERKRIKAGYGDYEATERGKTVLKTQFAIKQVLTQRYHAFQDARKITDYDPRFTWPDGNVYFTPEPADNSLQESSEITDSDNLKP